MTIRATRTLRVGAIAAAVLCACGAGVASARPLGPLGPAVPSAATSTATDAAATGALTELRSDLVSIGLPVPSGEDIAEEVEELAAESERQRVRFPVQGEFNWGQSGARFGAARSGHIHEGQDVFALTGTPLVSVTDGTVLETGNDGGRGNYVAIYDPAADRVYVYLHMVAPARVTQGERVDAGQWVGAVGCTGSCYGDHLHFEVRRGRDAYGPAEDPLPHLTRWADIGGLEPTLAAGAS